MRTLTAAACAAATLFAASPGAASAADTPPAQGGVTVTETALPERDLFPGSIVEGPDGNMWFAVLRSDPGYTVVDGVEREAAIARMTPDGELTEFPLPSSDSGVDSLVSGPDDAIWFLREGAVGRISKSGKVTEFSVDGPRAGLVVGSDGNLWFAQGRETSAGSIHEAMAKMTPAGQLTEYPLEMEPSVGGLALGPDGNVWFTESSIGRIGRITPAGEMAEFQSGEPPMSGIASGPDGRLWFTLAGGLGRITATGDALHSYRVPVFDGRPIFNGPDDRFWFRSGAATVGRLTEDGRASEIALRSDQRVLTGLAPGPDGEVWFTAEGEGPCDGGSSCNLKIYDAPGVIGRFSIDPLGAVVHAYRDGVKHHGVTLSIACRGGDADGVCHGTIRVSVKRTGRVLVSRRYGLKTDQGRTVLLSFGRRRGRRVSLPSGTRLIATVSVRGGDRSRRGIVVR